MPAQWTAQQLKDLILRGPDADRISFAPAPQRRAKLPRPSTQAARNRRYRQRLRGGRICVQLEVDPALVEALISARRLSVEAAEQRDAVERAVAGVLADWAQRWRC